MDKLMFAVLLLFAISSCVTFDGGDLITSSEYRDRFVEEEKEVFIEDDASLAIQLVSKEGCTIDFRPHSFLQNGNQYSGKLRIEFLIIHSKVDMILSGMHTMAIDQNGDFSLLESGGEFLLKAFDENGDELTLVSSFKVNIPKSLSEPTDSLMNLFSMLEPGLANGFSRSGFWSSVPWSETFFESDTGYLVYFSDFVWLNCDDIIDLGGLSHSIDFTYPLDFDEGNSAVFISLDNYPNSLASLDLDIPENESGHVICIARSFGHHHLVIEPFTSVPDLKIDFSNQEVSKIPNDEVDDFLSDILD